MPSAAPASGDRGSLSFPDLGIIQKLRSRDELPRRVVDRAERRLPAMLESPPDVSFGSFDTSDKVFQRERRPVGSGDTETMQ